MKSQAILMVLVILLTYAFDVMVNCGTNQVATYLMSTPRRYEDGIPFTLNESARLDANLFQFMQCRMVEIGTLSEDRVIGTAMHPEHLSKPHCIIR
jgi:hypothetical protein